MLCFINSWFNLISFGLTVLFSGFSFVSDNLCLKSLFYFKLQASGLAMLIIGIWLMSQLHKFKIDAPIHFENTYAESIEAQQMDEDARIISTLPIVFMALAASILVLAALACCCTAKGKVPLLYLVWLLSRILPFFNKSAFCHCGELICFLSWLQRKLLLNKLQFEQCKLWNFFILFFLCGCQILALATFG